MILDSLTALDRAQLLEVYARSVMLLELGRCEEWVDLFFPEALVRRSGANGPSSVEFRGHNELLGLGCRLMRGEFDLAVCRLAPPSRCRHVLTNITLFGHEARHASGYAFPTVTTIGGAQPPRWLASGKYSDRLHRCPAGCWRFQSRTFIADSAEAAALRANQPLTTRANESA